MVGLIREEMIRESFERYFLEALQDAKVRELADSCSEKGFRIIRAEDQEDPTFDLLVENPEDGLITAFGVKVLPRGGDPQDVQAELD